MARKLGTQTLWESLYDRVRNNDLVRLLDFWMELAPERLFGKFEEVLHQLVEEKERDCGDLMITARNFEDARSLWEAAYTIIRAEDYLSILIQKRTSKRVAAELVEKMNVAFGELIEEQTWLEEAYIVREEALELLKLPWFARISRFRPSRDEIDEAAIWMQSIESKMNDLISFDDLQIDENCWQPSENQNRAGVKLLNEGPSWASDAAFRDFLDDTSSRVDQEWTYESERIREFEIEMPNILKKLHKGLRIQATIKAEGEGTETNIETTPVQALQGRECTVMTQASDHKGDVRHDFTKEGGNISINESMVSAADWSEQRQMELSGWNDASLKYYLVATINHHLDREGLLTACRLLPQIQNHSTSSAIAKSKAANSSMASSRRMLTPPAEKPINSRNLRNDNNEHCIALKNDCIDLRRVRGGAENFTEDNPSSRFRDKTCAAKKARAPPKSTREAASVKSNIAVQTEQNGSTSNSVVEEKVKLLLKNFSKVKDMNNILTQMKVEVTQLHGKKRPNKLDKKLAIDNWLCSDIRWREMLECLEQL